MLTNLFKCTTTLQQMDLDGDDEINENEDENSEDHDDELEAEEEWEIEESEEGSAESERDEAASEDGATSDNVSEYSIGSHSAWSLTDDKTSVESAQGSAQSDSLTRAAVFDMFFSEDTRDDVDEDMSDEESNGDDDDGGGGGNDTEHIGEDDVGWDVGSDSEGRHAEKSLDFLTQSRCHTSSPCVCPSHRVQFSVLLSD